MHVFFSGIGGTAIGPLAMLSKQAGYSVSGSDKQQSQYTDYLIKKGLESIHIGQTGQEIAAEHAKNPIDWYVYSSAVSIEQPNSPEMEFCRTNNIKMTKRDDFLNHIINEKNLKLIAIAGTHGKTTTTAMAIWTFKKLGMPISWSVGAKIGFGDMGHYDPESEYFVLETDEFDRNFLSFSPHLSLITGVTWDHHEIFPTEKNYQEAFIQFIEQSEKTLIWKEDADRIGQTNSNKVRILQGDGEQNAIQDIEGFYNRLDAWLVANGIGEVLGKTDEEVGPELSDFPGLQRRMELITDGLYSDYAHTPEKIRGAMSTALEMAATQDKEVVVIYEPLTNRRQHFMKDGYQDCFAGAKQVYWIPSYLAREDPQQKILTPAELINHLSDPTIAQAMQRDESLKLVIDKHLSEGDMVICIAGGGGDSLDEWARQHFKKS